MKNLKTFESFAHMERSDLAKKVREIYLKK
jgi:hypothetical protein